jgi:hypothetical protein
MMSAQQTVAREMGVTHQELLRLLPRALEGLEYRVLADQIVVDEPGRALRIFYAQERERRIATMRIPVTDLTFRFAGYSVSEVDQFMRKFDQSFFRGGG